MRIKVKNALKLKKFKFLIILFVISLIYILHFDNTYLISKFFSIYNEKSWIKVYKSNCFCRLNESIEVVKIDKDILKVYLINDRYRSLLYYLSIEEYTKSIFTCNMFTSLRRGKKQKVISYTLFNKNPFYYEKIRYLSKQIRKFYPDWSMRVYHDWSINKSIICDIECQRDDDGELIDNADFCDISNFKTVSDRKLVRPVKYVLPRMWRFLAIGDSFIDFMMSRDIDSYIFQREVKSVRIWLKSDKLFHIMRDSPGHHFPILAGMWGIKIRDNRILAQNIFNLSIDSRIIKAVDPKKRKLKGDFLILVFFKEVKRIRLNRYFRHL